MGDHYFDRKPVARSRPRSVELTLPDVTVTLATDAGVFAADAVDRGTKILLLDGPAPPPGATDLLDLGCGYGPVAVVLARRAPEATVWAVDVNERARELCAANAAATGATNVRVVSPEQVEPTLRFDAVYSNPPVRIGKPALHALLLEWLERLRDGGRAELVVQKHLGADSLQRWLGEQGWQVRRLGSRQGYRLLEVTR